MASDPTLLDELRRQFQNSWWGVALLGGAAAIAFAGRIVDGLKKVVESIRTVIGPGLTIQPRVGRLVQFQDVAITPDTDQVYPLGAEIELDLRRTGGGDGEIRIAAIEVRLDGFKNNVICPFSITGDGFFGAGSAPVRVYSVQITRKGVASVQCSEENGTLRKGRTSNILSVEPPTKLTLHKSEEDSVETVQIRLSTIDPGQYLVSVWVKYATPRTQRERKAASLTICTP